VFSPTPANGATGVSTSTVPAATISATLNSINPSTYQLRDAAGNLIPATTGSGFETGYFTLTPFSPLKPGTKYTVTVKGGPFGIKDSSGGSMASDFTWSFTTAGT